MKPMDLVDFLLTPPRWSRRLERYVAPAAGALVVDSTRPARAVSRALGSLSPVRSFVLRNPLLREADWQVRKNFWSFLWSTVVMLQRRPRRAPVPRPEQPIRLLSAPETYADFASPTLVVPADVPFAERSLPTNLSVEMIHLLQDLFPVDAPPQRIASDDPAKRLRQAYTVFHRVVREPPRWHPDLVRAAQDGNLLGALGSGGPFAKLLRRVAPDSEEYEIDLTHLDDYDVRPGLSRLGTRTVFTAPGGELRVARIEHRGEEVSPGDARWAHVERIVQAGLVSHMTVWRQGMEYHVGGLAPLPVATHNHLPPKHPLRRLLAPHMAGSLLTAHSTHVTLRRNAWAARALSFPYETLMRFYDDGARAFTIERLDVEADAERRGIPPDLEYPWLGQALRYWEIFARYVRAYVELYYADDDAVQSDAAVSAWFDFLDERLVNGVRGYVPTLSREGLIKLCTLLLYGVSVGHTENSLWNYTFYMPTTVREDGVGQPIGEVQLTLNFQFLICAPTSLLLHDFSHLALDAAAGEIMRTFRSDLLALQREMEAEPDRYWRLYPAELEASVSA